jgi:hypothetical protein
VSLFVTIASLLSSIGTLCLALAVYYLLRMLNRQYLRIVALERTVEQQRTELRNEIEVAFKAYITVTHEQQRARPKRHGPEDLR